MTDRTKTDALTRCLLRLDAIGTNADRADGVLARAEHDALVALAGITPDDAESEMPRTYETPEQAAQRKRRE